MKILQTFIDDFLIGIEESFELNRKKLTLYFNNNSKEYIYSKNYDWDFYVDHIEKNIKSIKTKKYREIRKNEKNR